MYLLAALLIALALGAMYFVMRQKRRVSVTQASSPRVQRQVEDPTVLAGLRQNLRLKVGYNEATIDRLIQLERERLPNATLQTLMEVAIERWERENR